MRNLIQFIDRYSFFFLFLLFEVFAFYLLFKNNSFQQASFFNSTNSITGNFYSQYSNLTGYLNLKEVNQSLAYQNGRLLDNQVKSYQKLFGKNIYINDTIYERKYHFTEARVINNSTNKQNNYLTLDIGGLNGIKPGMGVISPSGVVGVIKNVSNHYSSVLSVLHRSAKISAKLKKSDYFGSMQWDGVDYKKGILLDIPNHVKITIGDTIVTSSYSSTFPSEMTIGTVASFEKPEGENFYHIGLDFSNDFRSLSQVFIVKNTSKIEQEELEEQTREGDD
jgi:rod shape-determining protein MreC